MDLTITLGYGALILIAVAAVAFGVVAQYIGEAGTGFEWLVDAIAFGIGAVVASEFIVDLRAIEPVWDGLALAPAVVGGVILGVLVEVITRLITGGSYTAHHRPTPA
jgi:uncharacterized membrane protein YeaQ/YmgE (transglycosylase-associated protein family)